VSFLHQYGLVAVLVALLLAPFGLPIPEEFTLLSAGALAWNGHTHLWAAYLVCWVGVVTGDTFLWTMGNRVGLHPKGFIGRRFGPKPIRRISRFYKRFGPWTVVICRNLPGTRFPAFFFAGATRMPLSKFILLDALAACLTTFILVTLGHTFGDEIGQIAAVIQKFRLVVLCALVAVGLAWYLWTRFRKKPAIAEVDGADSDGMADYDSGGLGSTISDSTESTDVAPAKRS
jgi:membrane protein DedA with SNARE-associated domain